ncbi:hypothetical protein K402DRAFT_406180 [Aulographum hederae CBS 113979]|uniref:Uncharacterized protein n=1 Tax=Aulographum hederae CBS 113979 TaxID=1176131 RepID=A0A6G1GTS4_9PEZI|nr:hypothetical protein K402DRAFT_406180 [Aulographum hederae CBS 113979]
MGRRRKSGGGDWGLGSRLASTRRGLKGHKAGYEEVREAGGKGLESVEETRELVDAAGKAWYVAWATLASSTKSTACGAGERTLMPRQDPPGLQSAAAELRRSSGAVDVMAAAGRRPRGEEQDRSLNWTGQDEVVCRGRIRGRGLLGTGESRRYWLGPVWSQWSGDECQPALNGYDCSPVSKFPRRMASSDAGDSGDIGDASACRSRIREDILGAHDRAVMIFQDERGLREGSQQLKLQTRHRLWETATAMTPERTWSQHGHAAKGRLQQTKAGEAHQACSEAPPKPRELPQGRHLGEERGQGGQSGRRQMARGRPQRLSVRIPYAWRVRYHRYEENERQFLALSAGMLRACRSGGKEALVQGFIPSPPGPLPACSGTASPRPEGRCERAATTLEV